MRKFFLSCCLLIITTMISGCTENKQFSSRNMPLYLNNFDINQSSEDLSKKFLIYAKECSYGIFSSAIKLADLYQSTLDPKNPNYLYFQQEQFAKPFEYCSIIINDSILNLSEEQKQESDTNKVKLFFSENEITALKDAHNAINNAIPKDLKVICEIIYVFYKNKEYTQANHWMRYLNKITLGDAPGFYTIGKYLFKKNEPEIKAYGYQLVEYSAQLSYNKALTLLNSQKYFEYRNANEELILNYNKYFNL